MNRSAIFSPIRYSSPITLFHYQRKKINHMETRWDTWLCCYHPNTGDINMHQETAFWRINWKSMLFSSVRGPQEVMQTMHFLLRKVIQRSNFQKSYVLCIWYHRGPLCILNLKGQLVSTQTDHGSNAFPLLSNCLKDFYCSKHIWNISNKP